MSFTHLFPQSYYWKGKIDNLPLLTESCNKKENLKERFSPFEDACLLKTFEFVDKSVVIKSLSTVLETFTTDLMTKSLRKNASIKFKECWLNLYYKNFYQESHTHNNPDTGNDHKTFSGVIFLNAGEEYSKFRFNNSLSNLRTHNITDHNVYFATIKYMPGDVIIFPCETQHYVTAHKSNDTRMTIAFNFEVESELKI